MTRCRLELAPVGTLEAWKQTTGKSARKVGDRHDVWRLSRGFLDLNYS